MTLVKCIAIEETESRVILDLDSDLLNSGWIQNMSLVKQGKGGDKKALTELKRRNTSVLYAESEIPKQIKELSEDAKTIEK